MSIEEIIKKLSLMAAIEDDLVWHTVDKSVKLRLKENADTYREAIALLKTHPDAKPNEPLGDGWIATKDRLPEPFKDVLVFYPYTSSGYLKVDTGIVYHTGEWMCERLYGPPTHWRPLPEPPKEETT